MVQKLNNLKVFIKISVINASYFKSYYCNDNKTNQMQICMIKYARFSDWLNPYYFFILLL